MTLEGGSNLVIAITAVMGTMSSVGALGWWLSGRFRKIETVQRDMLDKHEIKDQERHEENLERFRLISVALSQLGYKRIVPLRPAE